MREAARLLSAITIQQHDCHLVVAGDTAVSQPTAEGDGVRSRGAERRAAQSEVDPATGAVEEEAVVVAMGASVAPVSRTRSTGDSAT